eukprot:TRINITY_DN1014_c0_g2_i7.p1 TRINITY_DN1014_c0_g2~~TRINITY_DN1014_c0_g2_i7.p1  ORF type:complete len:434 (+),score=122.66 TRINITY_DN1014_c0_g2_i7:482-1783(+)
MRHSDGGSSSSSSSNNNNNNINNGGDRHCRFSRGRSQTRHHCVASLHASLFPEIWSLRYCISSAEVHALAAGKQSLEEQLGAINSQFDEFVAKAKAAMAQYQHAEDDHVARERDLAAALSTAKADLSYYQKQLSAAERAAQEKIAEANDLNSKVDTAAGLLYEAKQREIKLQQDFSDMRRDYDAQRAGCEQLQNDLRDFQVRERQYAAQNDDARQREARLHEEYSRAVAHANMLSAELTRCKGQLLQQSGQFLYEEVSPNAYAAANDVPPGDAAAMYHDPRFADMGTHTFAAMAPLPQEPPYQYQQQPLQLTGTPLGNRQQPPLNRRQSYPRPLATYAEPRRQPPPQEAPRVQPPSQQQVIRNDAPSPEELENTLLHLNMEKAQLENDLARHLPSRSREALSKRATAENRLEELTKEINHVRITLRSKRSPHR